MSAFVAARSAMIAVRGQHFQREGARPPCTTRGAAATLTTVRTSTSTSSSSPWSSSSSSSTAAAAASSPSSRASSASLSLGPRRALKNHAIAAPPRGNSSGDSSSSSPGHGHVARNSSPSSSDAAAATALQELPSGERVTPWWNTGPKLNNLVDVHSTNEFVACLHEAANLDKKNGLSRLVCVEFFAGWCFACRSLHPKFCKIAAKEFPDVLFIRVHKDELPELCDALGVDKLPYVQMYKGVDGVVDEFAMNNSAPCLAKFRRALRRHRDGACEAVPAGPATTVHTPGWPELYTAAHRRTFRNSKLSYYRVKGRGDGLPPPGVVDQEGRGDERSRPHSGNATPTYSR